MKDLWKWDATKVAHAIRDRQISCREAVTASLERLDAVNGKINAVSAVFREEALAEADRKDNSTGNFGPLHGVPITIKENTDQAGAATTNGLISLRDNIAKVDSPVVANFKKSGAIIIGRTTTPAFSLRWHTDSALNGQTFNPWDKDLTPGGSSGGAAASVAAGVTAIGHGNDYGGSVRFPAYCCGIAGLRPTVGRVPSFNPTVLVDRPISSQHSAVHGPLARRVGDLRLALEAMSPGHAGDPSWVPAPLTGPKINGPIRVAMTVNPANEGVDPAVAEAIRRAGRALEQAGYIVEEVEPPFLDKTAKLFRRIGWNEMRLLTAPEIRKSGDEGIKRVLELRLGEAEDTDLEQYMRDLALRFTYLREWSLFLERYPIILGPVCTEKNFKVGFDVDAAEVKRVINSQRMILTVSLLGLPAVTVPTGGGGFPLGVQVISSRFREDLCLDAAEAIESACGVSTPIDVQW